MLVRFTISVSLVVSSLAKGPMVIAVAGKSVTHSTLELLLLVVLKLQVNPDDSGRSPETIVLAHWDGNLTTILPLVSTRFCSCRANTPVELVCRVPLTKPSVHSN